MKKALLVIDMQEFTVGENHANIFKYPGDIVARVNKVKEMHFQILNLPHS
jgi:hypothetical protein